MAPCASRRYLGFAVLALLLVAAPPARADKCTGAKLKALGKYESSLAGCDAKVAAKNDPSLETACEGKAQSKFVLAFGKAGTCAGMQSTCEALADACEAAIVGAVPDNNDGNDKCESAKRKAAGKLASGELGCYAKAASKALPLDAGCIGKAQTKFRAALGKAGACPDGGSLQSTTETNCVAPVVITDGGGTVTDVCPSGTMTTTTTSTTSTTSTTTATLPCPSFITKWGSPGSGDGQFNFPAGMAVDGSGNVYVADITNNRIQKFTSSGMFLTKWSIDGPTGPAVDGSANVYVNDSHSRIQKFTSSGTFLTMWGSPGSGDGQFNGSGGVAVDGGNNVYVADIGNARIQKFTSDGTFLTKWGSPGSGDGQFVNIGSVAVDAGGNVYVVDNRIQKFTSDGTFLTKWGSYGVASAAVDGSGNVYVADSGNNRIQKFTSSGMFLTMWGSPGSGDGQFNFPVGVAVDGSGNVYVSEVVNARVQKFACP